MAASLTKPMKLTSSLSYRVATRRNCLSLLKKRSIWFLLVEVAITGSCKLAVPFGWNDDGGAGLFDGLAQMVCVVAPLDKARDRLVAEHGIRREALDQFGRAGDIAMLSGTSDQADG